MDKAALEQLFNELLDKREKAQAPEVKQAAENGLSAVKDAINGGAQDPQVTNPAPGVRVGRVIRALSYAKGDPRKAAQHALDKFHDEYVARALGTATDIGGGFLVPEVLSQEVIELLRPRSVMRAAGPVSVPMPVGTLNIPRLSGGATASYQGESVDTRGSQETLQQLRLSWKKLTSLVPVSNELLMYSSPGADTVVRDDLVLTMATAEDKAFLRNLGVQSSPRGFFGWVQSGNKFTSAGADTLAHVDSDLKTLIGKLEDNDVRMIRPAWFMSPRSKNFLGFLRNSLGVLVYPEVMANSPQTGTGGTLKGWPIYVTNNIPNNLTVVSTDSSEIYLVDMADVVLGEATQMILEVSNEASYVDSNGTLQSAFSRDETIIKAISRHDLVMRHDLSVALCQGVEYI